MILQVKYHDSVMADSEKFSIWNKDDGNKMDDTKSTLSGHLPTAHYVPASLCLL